LQNQWLFLRGVPFPGQVSISEGVKLDETISVWYMFLNATIAKLVQDLKICVPNVGEKHKDVSISNFF
jgi:hypothetical protein